MNLSALVILGPGQLSDGSMVPWGETRIDVAYERFITLEPQPYIILSGGRKSCINSEASSMRDYIEKQYPEMLKALFIQSIYCFSRIEIKRQKKPKYFHT